MVTATDIRAECIAQTLQALDLLAGAGQVVEVRIPKPFAGRGTIAGYFDDYAALADAAWSYSGKAGGVYMTLNPCNPALLARSKNKLKPLDATTSDADILRRVVLPIDADPVRPAGISSTDEEHEAALERVRLIREYLALQGWPDGVLGDSGNGGHLLYRLDLPNDDESKRLVEGVLAALSVLFTDERVKIDTGVGNAARIWKIYGTKAAKGEDLPDRPHRWARILDAPATLRAVPPDALRAMAAKAQTDAPAPTNDYRGTGRPFDMGDWLDRHRIRHDGAKPWRGGTLWNLESCPFSDAHTDSAWVAMLPSGARAAGCHHDSCKGKGWADLRRMYEPDAPATNKAAKTYTNGTGPQQGAGGQDSGGQGGGARATSSDAILRELAGLGYTFAWNELDDTIQVNGRAIDGGIAATIRVRMRDAGFRGMDAVEDAYTAAAYEQRFHPIRDWLAGLVWDGKDQLATLTGYFKDAHPPVMVGGKPRAIFARWLNRWMLGAVARVFEGGKVQNPMLVLNGGQDLGKSFFARWLCSGLPDYFIESPIRPDEKEHHRMLATRFVWEVAELGATTRRQDREALKDFITKGNVTFRKPYDRHPIVKPALASFIGTLNNENGFLTDPTGNRRFLSVTLVAIDQAYSQHIDPIQLWAEAVHYYRQGARWQLSTEERDARDALNKSFERDDPYQEMTLKYFDIDPAQTGWWMSTADIAEVLRRQGARDNDQMLYNGIGVALRRLGLESDQRRAAGTARRGYRGIREKSVVP